MSVNVRWGGDCVVMLKLIYVFWKAYYMLHAPPVMPAPLRVEFFLRDFVFGTRLEKLSS